MFLIVGLGNPGAEYARTRHNVGWLVLDELARRHGIELSRRAHDARIGGGLIGAERVLLAKPQTFMNLSGRAVAALARFYNVETEQLIVVADDLNLPLGKLRVRAGGSDGGHNGLKSVAQMLGGNAYPRLRFGVGAPPSRERQHSGTAGFVLRPFAPDEVVEVEIATQRAADCLETWLRDGLLAAMNAFNAAPS